MLPFRLFANPVVRVSAGINITSGMLLWCGIFFVPLFVQEVRGLSPTRSGLLLTPLMFGAAFGTLVSGKRVERSGSYRAWPIAGSLLSLVGMVLLTPARPVDSDPVDRRVRAPARHRRRLRDAALAPRGAERGRPS